MKDAIDFLLWSSVCRTRKIPKAGSGAVRPVLKLEVKAEVSSSYYGGSYKISFTLHSSTSFRPQARRNNRIFAQPLRSYCSRSSSKAAFRSSHDEFFFIILRSTFFIHFQPFASPASILHTITKHFNNRPVPQHIYDEPECKFIHRSHHCQGFWLVEAVPVVHLKEDRATYSIDNGISEHIA